MRRPGAARRAELEFSARALTVSAVIAVVAALLAVITVHDPGLTILCLLTAGWLTRTATQDRNEANTIDWEN